MSRRHLPTMADVLRRMEVPDCSCPLLRRPLCVLPGRPEGCEQRTAYILKRLGWRRTAEGDWVTLGAQVDGRRAAGLLRDHWLVWCRVAKVLGHRWDPDRPEVVEVECDCPYLPGPPCEHVRAMTPHRMPVKRWANALASHCREEYADLELPDRPTLYFPGEPQKVDILEERLRRGQGLKHPRDADPSRKELDGVGLRVERDEDNGAILRRGLQRVGQSDHDGQ